jgi:hypothetical protein
MDNLKKLEGPAHYPEIKTVVAPANPIAKTEASSCEEVSL